MSNVDPSDQLTARDGDVQELRRQLQLAQDYGAKWKAMFGAAFTASEVRMSVCLCVRLSV